MAFALRCQCGQHVLVISRPLREQLFNDRALGRAPWPVRLEPGERAPERSEPYDVPVAEMQAWFTQAMHTLEDARGSLPVLFTLVGRLPSGEFVPTPVYLRQAQAGTVMLEALQSPIIACYEYFTAHMQMKGDTKGWAARFGLPGALPVEELNFLDPEPTQVRPNWLKKTLWGTPFRLRRGDLRSCFDAELATLRALMSHVALTGERLSATED